MTDYALRYRFSASGQADVVRAFQSIGSAAAKASAAEERAATKAAQTTAKVQQARDKASGSAYRDAGGISRAAEKAADAEAKAAKRAADAKIREHQRALNYVARIRDRHFLAEQRQGEKMAEKAAATRAKRIGVVRDLAMTGLMTGAGAVGTAAMATVGLAARKEFSLRSKTRDIAIATRGAGQEAVSPEVLAREFQKTAIATPGQTAEGVADAVKAFTTKTGDLDMARKLQGTFATLASASGTDASSIGAASADLMQKFGITDETEMKDALGKLYMQGKAGSFELSDAAQKFPMMAAAAQRFGLDKGARGVATLGGLSQIARESTGSADQAGTAVEAMFRQLVSRSTELKGKGVEVFRKDGSARDVQDVLVDTISKVGGNDIAAKKVGLQKVFGDEGIRAISPLIDTFAEAVKEGTDPVKALRDRLESAINVTGAWADVQQDAAMAQESSGARLSAAWEAFSAQVGDAVVPSLVKMIESVTANGGALETLAGVAGVLAEAFAGTIDVLKEIPGVGDLFKPKQKPLSEAMADAEADVDKANKALAGGKSFSDLTPEQQQKIDAANKRYADIAMAQELEEQAMNNPDITEGEAQLAYKQIGQTFTGDEREARQEHYRDVLSRGTGQAVETSPDGESLVLDTDRAQQALDNFAAAVQETSSHVGSFGRGRGNPLGD